MCTVVNAPQNGGSKPAQMNTVATGDNVEYYCKIGYTIQGHTQSRCMANGMFSNPPPTCIGETTGEKQSIYKIIHLSLTFNIKLLVKLIQIQLWEDRTRLWAQQFLLEAR